MLYELRQYRVKKGMRDKFVRFMEREIIPFQTSKGMVIVGSFVGEEESDLYVWVRRFKNEAERVRLYKAVYESAHWKNKIAPRVPEMMIRDKSIITRLTPTRKSVLQ